jgi:hypothetical protein
MTKWIEPPYDLDTHFIYDHDATRVVEGMDPTFHAMLHAAEVGSIWHSHEKPKKEFWVSQNLMETATIYADTEAEALEQWDEIRGSGETEVHRFELPIVEEAQ